MPTSFRSQHGASLHVAASWNNDAAVNNMLLLLLLLLLCTADDAAPQGRLLGRNDHDEQLCGAC